MNAEVKPGYKLTEVGVIPEDWDVKSFAEIGNIKTGPFGTLLKASEYYAVEGVPLVSVRDIGEGKLTFDEYTPLVPILIVRRMPEYVLNDGDIVFGRKGGVDRSAIVQKHQVGCFLGSDGIRVRPSKVYHALFIAYQLQRKEIQAWLLKNATGTTMPSMNQAILRRISLPIPTKAEQEAIAEALSDADALIASLEQLIAKKRQIKQGAMQDLLTGKKRLPGFSGEWEVKSLGEISITNKGSQLHDSESTQDGTHPHLNGGIAPSGYAEKSNTPANTIAVSEGGNSCGYVQLMKVPYWCGGHCYSIISKCVDNDFLYHALKAQQTALMGLRVGSGLPNVQKTALLSFKLCYPSGGSEQTALAEILMDMDSEIEALEVKLEKAHQLKQCMMRKLLTGQIRLVRLTKDSCKVSELCSNFK